jgi:hypothetical protein
MDADPGLGVIAAAGRRPAADRPPVARRSACERRGAVAAVARIPSPHAPLLVGAFTAGQIDTSRAHTARIDNYLMDGHDNYEIDRATAETIKAVVKDAPAMVRANRAFVAHAVRELAETGVHQVLDIGAGLDPVTAHAACGPGAAARVALADLDPITAVHLQATCERDRDGVRVIGVHGDLLRPLELLAHPRVRDVLDLAQPVTVVLGAVLHHLADERPARAALAELMLALPPGSGLVVTHATGDFAPIAARQWADAYADAASPLILRTREQVAGFFDGLTLRQDGVTQLSPDPADGENARIWLYGAIGCTR